MRMSRRMGIHSQGGKIKPPIFTGDYEIVQIGALMYMYLKSSGTLTIQSKAEYDLFCVGGGGGNYAHRSYGGSDIGHGGAGGGHTKTLMQVLLKKQSLAINIGAGGSSGNGGATLIGSLISAQGGESPFAKTGSEYLKGGNGGSGGGAGVARGIGGNGGHDGLNGYTNSDADKEGGIGQGSTTRAFGESYNTLYAGGGGGAPSYDYEGIVGGEGGEGGGGIAARKISISTGEHSKYNGTPNTGGGAGGLYTYSLKEGAFTTGGSGIAIIRWAA